MKVLTSFQTTPVRVLPAPKVAEAPSLPDDTVALGGSDSVTLRVARGVGGTLAVTAGVATVLEGAAFLALDLVPSSLVAGGAAFLPFDLSPLAPHSLVADCARIAVLAVPLLIGGFAMYSVGKEAMDHPVAPLLPGRGWSHFTRGLGLVGSILTGTSVGGAIGGVPGVLAGAATGALAWTSTSYLADRAHG